MQARRRAGETADAMRRGIDPVAAKRAARMAVRDSFAAVVDEWFKRDQADNRARERVRELIARNVTAVWGERPITSITRRDAIDLIDGLLTVAWSRWRAEPMPTCTAFFAGRSVVASSK